MKLETFFEKFELFAEAPGAVESMRALVLDLAATGRLLADTDKWEKRLLKSVTTKIGSGATPAGGRESYSSEGTPLIRSMNVHFRGFQKSGLVFLSDEQANGLSNVIVHANDVLLNITGASIGRVTIAPIDMTGARVNQHVTIIRPTSELLPRFLSIFLASPTVQRMIDDIQVGATRQALTKGMIEQFEIPFPPLTEQNQIVTKVEELMALCDQLEEQQQEREAQRAKLSRASLARFFEAPTPANLMPLFHPAYGITPADLRKTVLTLAVQGKLAHQDPNDELAEELITRISTMRRLKNSREYAQIDADETPYDIPSSWSWVRLGNICLSSDSGWSPQCLPEARSGTDWGVLKVSAVSWGVYKPEENKALPTGMTSRPDCEVKAGDFLLSRANTEELVARSVVVDETPPRLMMSDKIVRFTFPNEIERAFVNLANTSDPSRAYYARNASGTSSSMKNIGREVMCNLPIPLPPIAEQRRIVARVEELMAMIDQLEVQMEKAKKSSAALLDAAIHELLNPREAAVDRTGIGCHVVHMLADRKTFGRTALAKFAYLAETHVGLPFNGGYLREAAGPLDPWIYRFEEEAARERWFTFENTAIHDGSRKIVYRKGDALEAKASEAVAALPKAQRDELDRVLKLLGGKPTEEVEIIATLFAVWNDFLIDGHSPSAEEIVTGFREHWHEKKQKFTAKSLYTWLDWMRRNGLVPTGRGPRTQQHSKLDLH